METLFGLSIALLMIGGLAALLCWFDKTDTRDGVFYDPIRDTHFQGPYIPDPKKFRIVNPHPNGCAKVVTYDWFQNEKEAIKKHPHAILIEEQ